jgi:hypothetical protein
VLLEESEDKKNTKTGIPKKKTAEPKDFFDAQRKRGLNYQD